MNIYIYMNATTVIDCQRIFLSGEFYHLYICTIYELIKRKKKKCRS